MSTVIENRRVEVIGGVDTHKDTHTVAVVDAGVGKLLSTQQFPATAAGYEQVLAWLRSLGQVVSVGVEGTGSYGAGLTCYLHSQGVTVIEVDRPDRKTRHSEGKSDPLDACAAARAVVAQRATGVPKRRDGQVEALRSLRVARASAIGQRSDVKRQIKTLIITAPAGLREQLDALGDAKLVAFCADSAPDTTKAADPQVAVMIALRSLAERHQRLSTEISTLDALITPLVAAINPKLITLNGVGPEVAGQLLVTAGENPGRVRSEAAFAMITGTAPLPASSGKTSRHRLNRGGDRQANKALHRIVLCRLRWDQRTKDYMDRRIRQGKSKKDIIRCLKRYIAREVYRALQRPLAA